MLLLKFHGTGQKIRSISRSKKLNVIAVESKHFKKFKQFFIN